MVEAPSLIAPTVKAVRVRVEVPRKYIPTVLFASGEFLQSPDAI
jgi:hypothetical protein